MLSLKTLQKVKNAKVVEFSSVKNTDSAYNGHITQGMQFLKDIVKERRENREEIVCSLGVPTDELERVFDKPPNWYSAMAIEMFMVQKCFTDGLGSSTVDGIHGAFASYWGAIAPAVRLVLQAVKTQARFSQPESCSITIQEIQKLMNWSKKNCPNEKLTSTPVDNVAELRLCLEYGLMQAFIASAFTLWTRCFELLSLQAGDIEDGCIGLAPYYIPHFKIHLKNRKGWQKEKGYDSPRTTLHLPHWKGFLIMQIGRELGDNNFCFPYIAPNGQGGAQYRFMFAPIGMWWSLSQIRWWGGWAIGEHVDTLIKYLVDSLQSYESGHGDTLHLIPLDPEKILMGDDLALEPVTREEFYRLKHSIGHIDEKLDDIMSTIASVTAESSNTVSLLSIHQLPSMHISYHQSPQTNHVQIPSLPALIPSSINLHQSILPNSGATSGVPSTLPISGVSIPDLGHSPSQWQEVDPVTKCVLKYWPKHWYTGVMRTVTGSKRSQWQIVFEEYERLGQSDTCFLEEYPDADKNITNLLNLIWARTSQTHREREGRGKGWIRGSSMGGASKGSEQTPIEPWLA
ncbi:hypothetical protein BYT27DRAFT_7225429 [Phlegmacium glaucopus]|nr:hypothetical protein BYT27DRAFT_7225429 [Phlegmacium glaucopus]